MQTGKLFPLFTPVLMLSVYAATQVTGTHRQWKHGCACRILHWVQMQPTKRPVNHLALKLLVVKSVGKAALPRSLRNVLVFGKGPRTAVRIRWFVEHRTYESLKRLCRSRCLLIQCRLYQHWDVGGTHGCCAVHHHSDSGKLWPPRIHLPHPKGVTQRWSDGM